MPCPMPNCNGIDHKSLCHACPHLGDQAVQAMPWDRNHPCFHCVTDEDGNHDANDSREQGHGRVSSAEAVPARFTATPAPEPDAVEDDWQGEFSAVAHCVIRALLKLPPKEVVTLLESLKLNPDGSSRTLMDTKEQTDRLFHENVTFQAVDIRLRRAYEALTECKLDADSPAFLQTKRAFRRFLCH